MGARAPWRPQHSAHVLLGGVPINGTPAPFEVKSAAPVPLQSRLVPPPNAEQLVADLEAPTVILLHTCDKYGNACSTGGLRIAGRLNLVKQNANDITILTPSNNHVGVDDLGDGSYAVKVGLLMGCSVKLIVNVRAPRLA